MVSILFRFPIASFFWICRLSVTWAIPSYTRLERQEFHQRECVGRRIFQNRGTTLPIHPMSGSLRVLFLFQQVHKEKVLFSSVSSWGLHYNRGFSSIFQSFKARKSRFCCFLLKIKFFAIASYELSTSSEIAWSESVKAAIFSKNSK